MFNYFIADCSLRELVRNGNKYTWTNKQCNPIRSILGRVLVTNEWEQHYPRVNVTPLLRVGSDHNTIIVNTNEDKPPTHAIFRFETVWLSKADFKLMILSSCLTHKIDRFKTTERISRFTSRKKCKG
jgi:hypothetical protein